MVRHDIAIVREFGAADAAFTALRSDLSIEQLAHFSIGTEFAVPSRAKRICDPADTELTYCLQFRDCFPPAAGKGTMDWADLVATKSHDFSPERC
jgi:hypothetical protein